MKTNAEIQISDFEENLLAEIKAEILELAEEVEEIFVQYEKCFNDGAIVLDNHNELLRNIHSIKGSLGMIGLEDAMESIHDCETFIIKIHESKSFTLSTIELMIDYWTDFCRSFESGAGILSFHENYRSCFDCLENNDFNLPCKSENVVIVEEFKEIEEVVEEEKVIVISSDENLGKFVSKGLETAAQYQCVNHAYRSLKELKDLREVIFDLTTLRVNPFFFHNIASKFNPNIHFTYLVENPKDLVAFLEELEGLPISFCVCRKDKLSNFLPNLKHLLGR